MSVSFPHAATPHLASSDLAKRQIDLVTRERSGDLSDTPATFVVATRQDSYDGVSVEWKTFVCSSKSTILELLSIYLDVIYPLSVYL